MFLLSLLYLVYIGLFLVDRLHVGKECRDYAEKWEQCADAEYELDTGKLGKPAEKCSSDATETKRQPEEEPCNVPICAGLSSVANTSMAENADEIIRPTSTASITVIAYPA